MRRMVVKKFSVAPENMTRRESKYKLSVAVTKLVGLPAGGGAATVEIRWHPWAGGRSSSGRWATTLLSGYLPGRRKMPARGVSRRAAVSDRGVVRWDASDGANRFERVCCHGGDVAEAAPDRSSCSDMISFSILYGTSNSKGDVNKLEEIGSTWLRVSDWIKESQSKKLNPEVKELKKELPIETKTAGLSSYALLHITVSVVEEITSKKGTKGTQTIEVGLAKDSGSRDQNKNYYFDGSATENLPIRQLLQLDKGGNMVNGTSQHSIGVRTGSSSERSSPEPGSTSRGHFRPWTKRNEVPHIAGDVKGESSRALPPRQATSGADHDDDPKGSWNEREFISRDKKTKLRVDTFFASIDQRDPTAGGESACTAIVAVIADALHSSGLSAPSRSKFDSLIREGSSEWQKLCKNASYMEQFPNKHFDIDTVLEAKVRPISIVQDKSFIGFFQPENFKSLRGAMSFDDIWLQITNDIRGDPQVYIVSWNDHFFILKLQASAYFVMDTLGERLYEGCNKAYMLRFDDSTEMYSHQVQGGDEEKEELICRGKECCREYIKRFLAAIPLEEELELEKKGTGSNSALHQRLQIEFQRTVACINSSLTTSRELVGDSNWRSSSSSSSWTNSNWADRDWKDTVWR